MNNGYFCGVLYRKHHKHFWIQDKVTPIARISKITFSQLGQNPLPVPVSPEKHLHADKETSPKGPKESEFWFLLCICQPPLSWGTLSHVPISLWQSPSSSPLLSPSCSWWNTQPAADLWDPYLKPPSLKLFQCLQDLFTQQNALHPPVLFKNSSLSIADHTKWLTGTSLTSVE